MYKQKMILAIIPARGGSKGLPLKNIRKFYGKPLIAWTIRQAKASKYIDRVIVSSDDQEICRIARRYSADVPFIRPKHLAGDNTPIIKAVLHAIEYLEKYNQHYDLAILLQPTSPLRTNQDIDAAIKLLFTKKAKAIVSVSEAGHNLYWCNILPKNGCLGNFLRPEAMHKNRQKLPVFYRLNGAIYLAYGDYLKAERNFFGPQTYAYKMPDARSIDIDTNLDFKIAELLFKPRRRI